MTDILNNMVRDVKPWWKSDYVTASVAGQQIVFAPCELETYHTPEETMAIRKWCINGLMPYMKRKTVNTRHTSYGLKHIAENDLGFYVSNGDIKVVMAQFGVQSKECGSGINRCYPIYEQYYRDRMRRDLEKRRGCR